MKQYCRYCGFCSEVDGGYYCGEQGKLMTESQIKHANNCKDYGYTDVGDVISGGQYHPRIFPPLQKGEDAADLYRQIELLEQGAHNAAKTNNDRITVDAKMEDKP